MALKLRCSLCNKDFHSRATVKPQPLTRHSSAADRVNLEDSDPDYFGAREEFESTAADYLKSNSRHHSGSGTRTDWHPTSDVFTSNSGSSDIVASSDTLSRTICFLESIMNNEKADKEQTFTGVAYCPLCVDIMASRVKSMIKDTDSMVPVFQSARNSLPPREFWDRDNVSTELIDYEISNHQPIEIVQEQEMAERDYQEAVQQLQMLYGKLDKDDKVDRLMIRSLEIHDVSEKAQLKSLIHENRDLKAKINRQSSLIIDRQTSWINVKEQLAALEANVYHSTAVLSQLRCVNVINDIFHIWTDGKYGVINGLRLGKLPNDNVQWEEVNGAWGNVALLLDCLIQVTVKIFTTQLPPHQPTTKNVIEGPNGGILAGQSSKHPRNTPPPSGQQSARQKSNNSSEAEASTTATVSQAPKLTALKEFRVIYRGSCTVIQERSDRTEFELFQAASGLSRYFTNHKFDKAMSTVLRLMQELIALANFIQNYIAKSGERLFPLHKITDDSVGGFSILCPGMFGSEEWTLCLRNMLENLKWLVGVVEGVYALSLATLQ